jgi:hypothetical protein
VSVNITTKRLPSNSVSQSPGLMCCNTAGYMITG